MKISSLLVVASSCFLLVSCGGSGAAGGADAGGDATMGGTFQLAWQDDFDAFDPGRWALQTHTWDGNLAQFSVANAMFANGIASLLLTPDSTDTAKPFRGVEMRSRDTVTYGKVESRIKFAKGSGVVSSL